MFNQVSQGQLVGKGVCKSVTEAEMAPLEIYLILFGLPCSSHERAEIQENKQKYGKLLKPLAQK